MGRQPHAPRMPGRRRAAAMLAASLGCLQPGIDPVFLSLLSRAGSIPVESHGWIVGATQGGMALGGLLVWSLGERATRALVAAAALCAIASAAATPALGGETAVITLRTAFGFAMGIVYTRAMAAYAAHRPTGAYGAVFLLQLVLSTAVSLALPAISGTGGERNALLTLAAVPLAALWAVLMMPGEQQTARATVRPREQASVPVHGWLLAAATFWFICATMMVWSFVGALAVQAALSEATIGRAVALGSIIGAATALAVMRERPVLPLSVAATACGLTLLAPPLATAPGADLAFIAGVAALNIGSTAMIIRCSGEASAASTDARFRTFVACTHTLGMIAGPLLGSVLVAASETHGLLWGAAAAVAAAVASVIAAGRTVQAPDALDHGEAQQGA